eukprot:SAG22_NODE_1575_length_4081_cov_6.202632_2_plen_71_part_00
MPSAPLGFAADRARATRSFNTWNGFACGGINASVMMRTADRFVSLGLRDLGYTYLNMVRVGVPGVSWLMS